MVSDIPSKGSVEIWFVELQVPNEREKERDVIRETQVKWSVDQGFWIQGVGFQSSPPGARMASAVLCGGFARSIVRFAMVKYDCLKCERQAMRRPMREGVV